MGTNEEVANNFLWYGGHQWRVLEFDTSEKTLTLITQQPLTAISPASAVWNTEEEYNSSYINQWLNDYFWDSLDSSTKSNVLDSIFNIGNDVEEIMINKKVVLLDQIQYERAGGVNSFLDIKDSYWLLNKSDDGKIIGVDNRAKEINRDTNLPFIDRNSIESLDSWVKGNAKTEIILPYDNIKEWKSQFRGKT